MNNIKIPSHIRAHQVERAAKAMSDLNVFALVVSILEGGHLMYNSPKSQKDAQRIIDICKDTQQHLLSKYDHHTALASS